LRSRCCVDCGHYLHMLTNMRVIVRCPRLSSRASYAVSLATPRFYITPDAVIGIASRGRLRRVVYFLVGVAGGGVGDGAGFGLPPSGFGK
jgi:hypothetical protein